MINRITLKNFKKFREKTIVIHPNGITVLVGGNNSGKSSVIHAFAIWEFGKMLLVNMKHQDAITVGFVGAGFGINIDDFTPVNIPGFKYLWTNLRSSTGYSMSIKCEWLDHLNTSKYLEISYALANERLFIKTTDSNLIHGDKPPTIAYLPPFAGITEHETWFSVADRKRLIGKGLAGSVLRNTIIDLFNSYNSEYDRRRGSRARIRKSDLNDLNSTHKFKILNNVLYDTFQLWLEPDRFNPEYHNYLHVNIVKGELRDNRFFPFSTYTKRDIMVEGSGFLQWLSVYTFALDETIDILLLDEPDAHLHSSLQAKLVNNLKDIAETSNKKVLLASHSIEIIKNMPYSDILSIDHDRIHYLQCDEQKIGVLAGLGSEYHPILHKVMTMKRVLFIENISDATLLKEFCRNTDLIWPENLAIWPFANGHRERRILFSQITVTIDGIKAISLVDRDNSLYEHTNNNLSEREQPDITQGNSSLMLRKWRRHEIENYLISTPAISRLKDIPEDDIRAFIQTRHSFIISATSQNTNRDETNYVLFEAQGKEVIASIEREYQITKYQIASEMRLEELFDDVKNLIHQIIDMCN